MEKTLTNVVQTNVPRGLHRAVAQTLLQVGHMDLRQVSEALRQRLIDMAMNDDPLVRVDADRVYLTEAGRAFARQH